jgi:Uma2 family endonuclease
MPQGRSLMSTAFQPRLFTEDEYLYLERKSEERCEFFRGEIFCMAGATRDHNVIAHNISRHLGNQLASRGCDVYQTDMKVRFATRPRYAYPDIVVVCGERQYLDDKQDVLLNPTLLIEVLSETTRNYDRLSKAPDYQIIPSLRHLLLVEQAEPRVDCFVREGKNTWTQTFLFGLNGSIELPAIGCALQLADIYAGVEFPSTDSPPLRVAD